MKFESIQNLSLILMSLWITSPMFAYSNLFRASSVIALLVYIMLEMKKKDNFLMNPSFPMILAAIYIFYDFILIIIYDLSPVSSIQDYIFLFFLFVYEGRKKNLISLTPVFWFLLFTLPIWLITTIRGYDTFGTHASRYVVRSSEMAVNLMKEGIGGYSLIYGALFLIPIVLPFFLSPRSFNLNSAPKFVFKFPYALRGFFLLSLILVVGVIIKGGYSTSVIIASILFSTVIILNYSNNKTLIWLSFAGIAPLMMYVDLYKISNFLYEISFGTNYYNKLHDVQVSLLSMDGIGTLGDRIDRYVKSISIFFENPLFGVGNYDLTGNHSSYLDNLAQRGIIFGGIYFYLLLYLPFRMVRKAHGSRPMSVGVLCLMILFPLLNNVPMIYGPMLFIMFPVGCALKITNIQEKNATYPSFQ